MLSNSLAVFLVLGLGSHFTTCLSFVVSASTSSVDESISVSTGLITSRITSSISAFPTEQSNVVSSTLTAPPLNCGDGTTRTTTIRNAQDVSAIASCDIYYGDVVVATDVAAVESHGIGSFALDGIREITGSLNVNNINSNLQSISGDSLQRVGYNFQISDVDDMANVEFPLLSHVGNSFILRNLGSLDTLNFSTALSVDNYTQISHTGLTQLDQNSLNIITPSWMEVTNNSNLVSLSLPIGASGARAPNAITISSNGIGMTTTFPNLTIAGNISLTGVSQAFFPVLDKALNDFNITGIELVNLQANLLASVGGSFILNDVPGLHNLRIDNLRLIGNNLIITKAQQVTALYLPSLQTVNGYVEAKGNFSDIEIPDIITVQGSVSAQSESDISTACEKLGAAVKGKFTCLSNYSDSEQGGLTRGGKIGVGIGVTVGGIIILILAYFGVVCLRKRRRPQRRNDTKELEDHLPSELGRTGSGRLKGPENRHELQTEHGASELGDKKHVFELEGDNGATEMHQREKFSFEAPREHEKT